MRIFFAGLFNSHVRNMESLIVEYKPKYILDSFYYKSHCEKIIKFVETDNFLLDSGAFTFMSGAKITKKEMYTYINQYIDFINKYDVKHFIEIDVESIFGMEQVEEWRNHIEVNTGKKVIPVWHINRGIDYWKNMIIDYKYVAIGGQVQKIFNLTKADYDIFKKMIKYARSKGVKVHGLGFTKTKEIAEYQYFSVDSSTWKMGAILGRQIHKFNGKDISVKRIENNKKVDFEKMVQHNFIEWCKYQKYMDRGII
jgi:hypothetical protein